jgi:hypothetical protein
MSTKDLLRLENLEQAVEMEVPGHERDWAERVAQALNATAQAVREHLKALKSSGPSIVQADRPRLPSPTVARRTAALERTMNSLVADLSRLGSNVRDAAQAFDRRIDPREAARSSAVAGKAGAIPDFGELRRRCTHVATALRRLNDAEAQLILESVNTDIGAPD